MIFSSFLVIKLSVKYTLIFFSLNFRSSRNLKLEAGGGYSTSPSAAQRQHYQKSRSAEISASPPMYPIKGSENTVEANNLSSSLIQQLTVISSLLSTQQVVRVDQITTLLNEKASFSFQEYS